MVNHYYIYALDRDFGPFFLKFCSYFPFNAKLCLNGHEYAKRQLAQEGIAFEALDNGVLSCADPKRLQQICDGLTGDKINALLRKWLRLLPHPFTPADRKAGYRYDISILQAEFSLTQVLDRPAHGRLFFEQVIRENLDLGRPQEVQLIFQRRIVRGSKAARLRTRIVTQDVTPSLNVYYKNARIKQYHKENRALRTETTINNTYDFAVGRRLHNLPKLRQIGFTANRRLIEVERLSHDCMLAEDAFQAVNRPVTSGCQRASSLRFADPRVHSLLHAIIMFRQLTDGFRAADLRQHLAALDRRDPASISQAAVTYQAPAAPSWANRTRLRQLPLSRHRPRLPRRSLLHQDIQPHSEAWISGSASQPGRPRQDPQPRLRQVRRKNQNNDRSSQLRTAKLDTFASSLVR